MTDAKTLARYLLYLLKEQMNGLQVEEFDVTPLKLQKLLYYCQGYALALTGKPLFADPIEAWKYGPVVGSVYREYKAYGKCCIPFETVEAIDELDEIPASIARLVVNDKGRLSGIALANATHLELPWKDTYKGMYTHEKIPCSVMKDFFSSVLLKKELSEDDEDGFWLSSGEPLADADWDKVFANV